jgi:hypothetical protein
MASDASVLSGWRRHADYARVGWWLDAHAHYVKVYRFSCFLVIVLAIILVITLKRLGQLSASHAKIQQASSSDQASSCLVLSLCYLVLFCFVLVLLSCAILCVVSYFVLWLCCCLILSHILLYCVVLCGIVLFCRVVSSGLASHGAVLCGVLWWRVVWCCSLVSARLASPRLFAHKSNPTCFVFVYNIGSCFFGRGRRIRRFSLPAFTT